MVTIRGETMVRHRRHAPADRQPARASRSIGACRAAPCPQVFSRLVSVEGEGYLVLSREQRALLPAPCFSATSVSSPRSTCGLSTPGLMWDVGLLPGSRNRPSPCSLVRTAGEGAVALRVPGGLVAIKVTPDRPYRVRDVGMVGWVGNVIPRVSEDPSIIRCEGEGAILINLPHGSHVVRR